MLQPVEHHEVDAGLTQTVPRVQRRVVAALSEAGRGDELPAEIAKRAAGRTGELGPRFGFGQVLVPGAQRRQGVQQRAGLQFVGRRVGHRRSG